VQQLEKMLEAGIRSQFQFALLSKLVVSHENNAM
jgi:hypothetical protein